MTWTLFILPIEAFISVVQCSASSSAADIRSISTGYTSADTTTPVTDSTATKTTLSDTRKITDRTTVRVKNATDEGTSLTSDVNEAETVSTTASELSSTTNQLGVEVTKKVSPNATTVSAMKPKNIWGLITMDQIQQIMRDKCLDPNQFGEEGRKKSGLVNCMVMNIENKSASKNASEKLCQSYKDRFMGFMYRLPNDRKKKGCWMRNNGSMLVCACNDRCLPEEFPENYSKMLKPCEKKDQAYHKYVATVYEKESTSTFFPKISDEEFEIYWSAMDDVIESLEKNVSIVSKRVMITTFFSPQKQKEIYGIPEYILSTIVLLWSMFCGMMICKLLQAVSVVILDMEAECERDY